MRGQYVHLNLGQVVEDEFFNMEEDGAKGLFRVWVDRRSVGSGQKICWSVKAVTDLRWRVLSLEVRRVEQGKETSASYRWHEDAWGGVVSSGVDQCQRQQAAPIPSPSPLPIAMGRGWRWGVPWLFLIRCF